MPTFRDKSITKPPCFGFADTYDPACSKCALTSECIMELQARRPPCFASYNDHYHQCLLCMLRSACKEGSLDRVKKGRIGKTPITLDAEKARLSASIEATLARKRVIKIHRKKKG